MKPSTLVQHSIQLPFSGPPVLAVGGLRANTLCLSDGEQAHVSRTLGDLDSAAVCLDHETAVAEMLAWLGKIPAVVARDIDPDIHATRFAIELAGQLGVPNLPVQHHHAHVAAICAEHRMVEPVIGLVLDDMGLGSDGASWGGELLRVDGHHFDRLGHLVPLPMPGGVIAMREPWRLAAALLHGLGRGAEIVERYGEYPAAAGMARMLDEGRSCPPTTCARHMTDAVAVLLNLDRPRGVALNAALEAAAMCYFNGKQAAVADDHWHIDERNELDLHPLFADLADETNSEHGAAMFHACLISGATEWVVRACGAHDIRSVIIGGASLSNRLLATGLRNNLERRGLNVLAAIQMAPDDSALSLGQAWVAIQSPS